MVSPCSSSSKQMAHSPESLDRMSSEKDNTDKDKVSKACIVFTSGSESCITICLTFGARIPVICVQMRTGTALHVSK